MSDDSFSSAFTSENTKLFENSEIKTLFDKMNNPRIADNRFIESLPTSESPKTRSRSPSPTRPLLRLDIPTSPAAPLARVELDDDGPDDRETANKPYPGVDDGFFSNGDNGVDTVDGFNNNEPNDNAGDPDVELIPTKPRDPEEIDETNNRIPGLTPRVGGDGGNVKPDVKPVAHPEFPRSPGFRPWGWDVEVASLPPETIPDLNVYQHKKTLAQGMMDLALFSANANQLRYVVETFNSHPYFYPSLVLISISLILQVAVGIGLIWNATYNVKDEKSLCIANKLNNFTTICIFLITVINVFISAFGVAPAPS